MKLLSIFILAPLMVAGAQAQDVEPSPDNIPAPPKPVRDAYQQTQLKDFPRDEHGFLKPEVWDIIDAEGARNPGFNEARAEKERSMMKTYFATYANWTAPEPSPLPPGKLRNLSDAPTAPRFPLTDKVWPEKPGDASVCLWEDDKLAAMSLGVDDNCAMDVPYWKELSKKYGGLNITWNLITHNVDGVVSPGRVVAAGKWSDWQKTLDEGYHIASHSVTHNHDPVPSDGWPGPDWEAAESQHQIDSHLTGHKTRLFALPGAGVHAFGIMNGTLPNTPWRASLSKYYAAVRTSGGQPMNQANMIDYFNIHSTTAVKTILDNSDPKYAEMNLNNLFAADPNSKYHKYYRGWANTFIHFINEGKDFDHNPYVKVLEFYRDHRDDLWTGFTDDIALYGEERDTATLTTDSASDTKITFTLTDQLAPALFGYPLTVKVRLPGAWKVVDAVQTDKKLPVQIISHEGVTFALVKAIPGRGQVVMEQGK